MRGSFIPVQALRECREAMAVVAASQGGAFTRAQALSADVPPHLARRLVERGLWRPLRRGVYVDRDVLDAAVRDPVGRVRIDAAAAILAAPRGAVAAHVTACRVRHYPLPQHVDSRLHVLRPPGSDHRALAGVVVHTHQFTPAAVDVLDGLPTSSPALTVLLVLDHLPRDWGIALVDHVLHTGDATREQLDAELVRLRSLRHRSRTGLVLRDADGRAESPLESLSRVRLVARGVPAPVLQPEVRDAQGVMRGDLGWPACGVVGEADGMAKYGNGPTEMAARLAAQRERQDRLEALGLIVVRWTWDEIMQAPLMVAQRVLAALDRGATLKRAGFSDRAA